jgi:Glycosyltransferase family 10 (fucosyltransferase) C-term
MDGHKHRFSFLTELKKTVDFEWYGRGVNRIDDKWDGLAPFRYSLAFENFYSDYYWTEKLIDCFLTWTMPIYCGSQIIADFFPAESFVQIDIRDPIRATQQIVETLQSGRCETHFEALNTAREMVLQKYNTLAFLADRIEAHHSEGCGCQPGVQKIRGRVFSESIVKKAGWILKHGVERVLQRPT